MKIILSALSMCFLLLSPIAYGEDNVEALKKNYNENAEGLATLFHELEKTAADIRQINERFKNISRIMDMLKNINMQMEREIDALKNCEGFPDHPDHG